MGVGTICLNQLCRYEFNNNMYLNFNRIDYYNNIQGIILYRVIIN